VYLAIALGIPLVVAPLASGLIVRLLDAVAEAYDELDRVASTDDLTGLSNRRRFFELVEARVAALGEGEALVVGMLDVDRFKEINDTFGHAIGDAALRAVATRLRAAAGPEAIVARLGGDELACVVPEAPGTHRHLERALAAACAGIAIGEDVRVSASIGFGRVDRVTPIDAALAVADAELYAVKSRRAPLPGAARTA
jgi:diguanylate cyclase (GGDEF)-like protein